MNLFVIFLINISMKQKMNFFHEYEHKNISTFLSNKKTKFNLEPKT